MTVRICGSVLALLCLFAGGAGGQGDPLDAAAVWEQAIAAKGGRDRLHAIRSFAVRERYRLGRKVRGIVGGKIDQIVCEPPDNWWEFLDYRPGEMGYSVRVVNVRTGAGWASHSGSPARPFMRPDTNTAYRLRQLQYVYSSKRARCGRSRCECLACDVDCHRWIGWRRMSAMTWSCSISIGSRICPGGSRPFVGCRSSRHAQAATGRFPLPSAGMSTTSIAITPWTA